MNRGTGIVLGASLAFVSGVGLSACSPSDSEADEAGSAMAAEAQTTQATLPVVTVYKSPT